MKNKKGLVIGVANQKSIAWGISEVLSKEGANLALTYQGNNFKKRVQPLAESIGSKFIFDVDVKDESSLDSCFKKISDEWGSIDFLVHSVAFSDKSELMGRFINTSRENFLKSIDISCYSLIDVSKRALPLMSRGGSILTLSYLGAQRVTPNYNVMGIAKAALESTVRYLASDLGQDNIRVNAISAGPMKTLAGAAIGGARRVFRLSEQNSPLGSNPNLMSVGGAAAFLLSDYGMHTSGEVLFVDGGYHVMGMPKLDHIEKV